MKYRFNIRIEMRPIGPWAVISRDDGLTVWQFGPYPSEREAQRSARFRLAQHYQGSHRFEGEPYGPAKIVRKVTARSPHKPGPRVDLPGQLELPDTGEDMAGLAKLKGGSPLKPTAPQKPCDIGLFSDNAAQIDLVDIIGRKA
jgi:hypothetical protein